MPCHQYLWIRELRPAGQIQPTTCFYKVLLEHSHIHPFTFCPELLAHYSSEAESSNQRAFIPQSLRYYNLPFPEKACQPLIRTVFAVLYAWNEALEPMNFVKEIAQPKYKG